MNIVRTGIRPIAWDLSDSSCPQTEDIFTYEPFSSLQPATVVKLFWEYETGRVVESCHSVEQFNRFVQNRRSQFPRGEIRDPNVQLIVTQTQIQECIQRQTFLETSTIATFVALLVRKGILPRSLVSILGRVAAWQQALSDWNDIPENRELNRHLQAIQLRHPVTRVEQVSMLTILGLLLSSTYQAVLRAYPRLSLEAMPVAAIVSLAALLVVVCFAFASVQLAEEILDALRSATGIRLPSAHVLVSSYYLYQHLLSE